MRLSIVSSFPRVCDKPSPAAGEATSHEHGLWNRVVLWTLRLVNLSPGDQQPAPRRRSGHTAPGTGRWAQSTRGHSRLAAAARQHHRSRSRSCPCQSPHRTTCRCSSGQPLLAPPGAPTWPATIQTKKVSSIITNQQLCRIAMC